MLNLNWTSMEYLNLYHMCSLSMGLHDRTSWVGLWDTFYILQGCVMPNRPNNKCHACHSKKFRLQWQHMSVVASHIMEKLTAVYNNKGNTKTLHHCPFSPHKRQVILMMSSNGNIFRVTGHLCGEFTGPRWIPCTKAGDVDLWCFLWFASE